MFRFWLIILILLPISSCSVNEQENISAEFGKAARKLGLFPVYPPREEFQIGDVYMWSQSVKDPNDTVSVYLDTIHSLASAADEFMKSRIVFTDTQFESGTRKKISTDIPGQSSSLKTRRDLADGDLAKTLPIAAFPSVTTDAGFSAGFGLNRVLFAVGLAGGERTTVTLNFNDVRTYWVPAAHAYADIHQRHIGSVMANYSAVGRLRLNRQVALTRGANTDPCRAGRRCGVTVVTRVYLTRQITYTYRNNRIIAAALRHAQTGGDPAAGSTQTVSSLAVTLDDDNQIDSTALSTQIAAVREQVKELSASTTNGESFQFEAWNARGVTFSSTYQRPVAIGWDGLDYKLSSGG
ncbi:hypothetical protein [Hoeflea sp.]|uniref:hypothetical protein n=1 Tax=Hoeflea sp. TaxID=1940281 RepID=UPI003B522B75